MPKKEMKQIVEEYDFGVEDNHVKDILLARLSEQEKGVRYTF